MIWFFVFALLLISVTALLEWLERREDDPLPPPNGRSQRYNLHDGEWDVGEGHGRD
jgi:hypothetical protein